MSCGGRLLRRGNGQKAEALGSSASRQGKEAMQTYSCQHCGLSARTIFDLFLHIFTQHMHKDVGLTRKEVRRLLREARPLDMSGHVISKN